MTKYFHMLIFAIMAIVTSFCFAGEGDVVVPGASVFDSIGAILAQIDAKAAIIGAIAVDFLMRYAPTRKSLGVLQIVGAVAKRVGDLLVAFGMLVDKILGQKLKDSDNLGKK